MNLHPKVAAALEEIDAAVFSSDTFIDAENRSSLTEYMTRWQRELAKLALLAKHAPKEPS